MAMEVGVTIPLLHATPSTHSSIGCGFECFLSGFVPFLPLPFCTELSASSVKFGAFFFRWKVRHELKEAAIQFGNNN